MDRDPLALLLVDEVFDVLEVEDGLRQTLTCPGIAPGACFAGMWEPKTANPAPLLEPETAAKQRS